VTSYQATMPTKKFAAPLRIAVVGLGRMGSIHAYHALELARETGICELVAVSTAFPAHADQFFRQTDTKIPVFPSIEELAAANVCDAAIIVTNTALHREHATLMLDAGQRIFLEKPLTGTLEGDREFSSYLELFKIYSALEDSAPAPNGFNSTGLLADMGIHNIDEILWLSGRTPRSAAVVGSRIYSHRLTTCQEDFDDAMLLLDFDGDPGTEMIGEVQVGRNHVAGYRGETVLYGEEGQICVGRFDGDPRKVNVEVYRRRGSPAFSKSFATRNYNEPLPEFVDRFGAAYKDELRIFIQCCLDGSEFPTRHLDALRAQEIIEAGMSAIVSRASMAEIRYANPVSFRNL
jgi:predicted dehydrogenase